MDKKVYSLKKRSRTSTFHPERSRIGNRKLLNKSKLKGETESSSAKKLKMSQNDYNDVTINQSFSYRIINFLSDINSRCLQKMWITYNFMKKVVVA